jgi:hypothetical protein
VTKIVVLFNLQAGVDPKAYESWAKSTDLPVVNKLASVNQFDVLKCGALLGSDQTPPYQYVEIIELNDQALFFEEVSTETMQKVAAEFQAFADNPLFIVSESL